MLPAPSVNRNSGSKHKLYIILGACIAILLLVNAVLMLVPLLDIDVETEALWPSESGKSKEVQLSYPKQAYVFLMTNDKLMTMLFALEASFKDVKATRRRIVLCTKKVSQKARNTLVKLGMEVRAIDQPYHPNFNVGNDRWKDTLAKFAIFKLSDLDKFVYFDADYILVHNTDYLFDIPTRGAVTAMIDGVGCRAEDFNMNAGLMVAHPNQTLYDEIFDMLDDPSAAWQTKQGDQDLLNHYLQARDMMQLLPEGDATFIWRCICRERNETKPFSIEGVKAVHFTGWWLRPYSLITTGKGNWPEKCGIPWYDRWLAMYHSGMAWWKQRYPNEEPQLGPEMYPPPPSPPVEPTPRWSWEK